jgi:predicted RecA/RadA family phage recombinase
MSRTIKKKIGQDPLALSGVTRGNDIGFRFTIKTPTALSAAKLAVKADLDDPDGSAVVNKTVTPTPSSDGQIIDPGTVNGIAIVMFVLAKTETEDFTAGQKYFWDIEVFDVTNNSSTPRDGTIQFKQRVRTAIG